MNAHPTNIGAPFAAASRAAAVSRTPDDALLLRTAAQITRDLHAAKPAIYWADLIISAALGYGGLAVAVLASGWLQVAGIVIAILALYRAGSFIHELTHLKPGAVPFFRAGWNAIIGVPLLVPSFMYEGVHTIHHTRTRYGTIEDPEYLPLALMKPWSVPLFVLAAALAPVALLLRYGVLAPLSLLIPGLRATLVARYSSLTINPEFRRRAPEGSVHRDWLATETACALWAMTLIAGVATGTIPLAGFAIALGIVSGVTVLNQVRTLVAHLWENEGEPMTVTAQYLDSVNVPPPALLPALWAPVGLRYHALHHLVPSVPYHALGEAHRRLKAAVPDTSPYHLANHPGLPGLLVRLVSGTAHQ